MDSKSPESETTTVPELPVKSGCQRAEPRGGGCGEVRGGGWIEGSHGGGEHVREESRRPKASVARTRGTRVMIVDCGEGAGKRSKRGQLAVSPRYPLRSRWD